MKKQSVLNDSSIVGSPIVHLISLFILLFVFWIGLSGSFKIKFLIYGILTSAITAWLTYPLLLVANEAKTKKYFIFGISIPKFIAYAVWLLWQLILANIDVLRATSSQNLAIDPKVVRFHFKPNNPMATVVLANSITLTPGTVTLNVTDSGIYEIHALTEGAAAGIYAGDMPKKVAELFGEKNDFYIVESEE